MGSVYLKLTFLRVPSSLSGRTHRADTVAVETTLEVTTLSVFVYAAGGRWRSIYYQGPYTLSYVSDA